jgi:hypothetical protein
MNDITTPRGKYMGELTLETWRETFPNMQSKNIRAREIRKSLGYPLSNGTNTSYFPTWWARVEYAFKYRSLYGLNWYVLKQLLRLV